jgi:serine/threonine protein kinase
MLRSLQYMHSRGVIHMDVKVCGFSWLLVVKSFDIHKNWRET